MVFYPIWATMAACFVVVLLGSLRRFSKPRNGRIFVPCARQVARPPMFDMCSHHEAVNAVDVRSLAASFHERPQPLLSVRDQSQWSRELDPTRPYRAQRRQARLGN